MLKVFRDRAYVSKAREGCEMVSCPMCDVKILRSKIRNIHL
jgi:hypothetical protein